MSKISRKNAAIWSDPYRRMQKLLLTMARRNLTNALDPRYLNRFKTVVYDGLLVWLVVDYVW